MAATDRTAVPRKRADAARNEQTLLAAAATVFVRSGVDAPVRAIAAEAGVGMGTIYRHFPTRSDLIVAVFRHQVEALVDAVPVLLDSAESPFAALRQWINQFVDFLVTKHGLAEAMQADSTGLDAFHTYFLGRLVPACDELLAAARDAGEILDPVVDARSLLRTVGGICYGAESGGAYDAAAMVQVLLAGLQRA